MEHRRLYETILGLERPGYVERVEVRMSEEQVWVYLERDETVALTCPDCGEAAPGYDRSEERRWQHLDMCQYTTVLAARIPRARCEARGVRQVVVPWAEAWSRRTALFEAFALRVLVSKLRQLPPCDPLSLWRSRHGPTLNVEESL